MQDLKQLRTEDTYATTEFPLAVTIFLAGIPLLGLEPDKNNPHKVSFHFDRSDPNLDNIISGYFSGSYQCSPKDWHSCSRELKSRIRATLTDERG